MILEVEDLTVTLNRQGKSWTVIKDINFSLNEGEKLGIVGESGSGKTVLARSIVRLLPHTMNVTKGDIRYRGGSLLTLSALEMQKIRGREIGMVFQDPLTYLNPTKRIGMQIIEGFLHHFPQKTKDEARKKALELLHSVGIPNPEVRYLQYPHELSGGQRQRVLIAMALAAHPSLLIADEPTTALDAVIQGQIMQLLAKLQKDNAMILISHDLHLVASFCNRVLVMYAGQIIEDAKTEDLFASPKHPYTQQLLAAIPTLSSSSLMTIPGSPPKLSDSHLGCPFAPRCAKALPKCHKEAPTFTNNSRCHLS